MKNKYLYHGSSIDGIEELIPQLSNHNKKYVYITDNYCLAIIYAYNPLPRPEGFFTYRFSKDGKLNYDEYFSNQLEKIYKNKKGFVYVVEDLKYKKLENNPWTYLSENNVKVIKKIVIEDIYVELIKQSKLGNININFYDLQNQQYKDNVKTIVLEYLNENKIENESHVFYKFVKEHLPEVIKKSNH